MGYLYIAQPPLYKIKISGKEKYIKNDDVLKDFLLEHFLIDNKVHINNHLASRVSVESAMNDCEKIAFFTKSASNENYNIVEAVFHYIIKNDLRVLDEDNLRELENLCYAKFNHKYSMVVDESGAYLICEYVVLKVINRFKIQIDDVMCEDEIRRLYSVAFSYFDAGAIKIHLKNGKEIISHSPTEFVANFTKLYRDGLTIQRFKGLGEMNPEQLWETTMDASVRQLLQVNIDNLEITENMFAVLMGDNVELRRAFIENSSYLLDEIDT